MGSKDNEPVTMDSKGYWVYKGFRYIKDGKDNWTRTCIGHLRRQHLLRSQSRLESDVGVLRAIRVKNASVFAAARCDRRTYVFFTPAAAHTRERKRAPCVAVYR